jgi:hypothetical protein
MFEVIAHMLFLMKLTASSPLAVRELPFVHDLRQKIQDILVHLFQLIKQVDRMRGSSNGLSQLSTLFLSDTLLF